LSLDLLVLSLPFGSVPRCSPCSVTACSHHFLSIVLFRDLAR